MHRIDTTNKAVDLFGAGKHGWRDGNKALGINATEFNAAMMNMIQEELCLLVETPGTALDPNNHGQILAALRGAGLFQTAAQFDNTTKAATTEFVQRALGNRQGTRVISGANSLVVADLGKEIICGGAGAYTVNLPSIASIPEGASYDVWVNATNPVSFASAGAEVIYVGQGSTSVTPYTAGQGEQLVFTKYSGGWVISGSAQLKYSAGFGASLSTYGYQKLPSGILVQWGAVTNQSSGVPINYVINFPTQTDLVLPVSKGTVSGQAQPCWPSAVSTATWTPLMGAAGDISFLAIGH